MLFHISITHCVFLTINCKICVSHEDGTMIDIIQQKIFERFEEPLLHCCFQKQLRHLGTQVSL